MAAQVCISCLNKKSVNATTNRLVTERCGHVKCIDCLVLERTGCAACAAASPAEAKVEPSDVSRSDSTVQTNFTPEHFLVNSDGTNGRKTEYYRDKKKKPDTSHISIEFDENGKFYMCTVCNKCFRARSQVGYHAYCNGQKKPYHCSECNKSFASQSHYKYHMRVHRNEKCYACEICGEAFFQMSKLQRHKLKHTNEKKYKCGECHKAFSTTSALRKHDLTHTDTRPYECAHCGVRFRDRSNLKRHVLRHKGVPGSGRRGARAHVCSRCPQTFYTRNDLRRHAAIHEETQPFHCKPCKRRFRRKDNFERHVRNTHPLAVEATPKLELLEVEAEVIQDTEKSMIIEANNARRSVIFGPIKSDERPPSPKASEYVHKIRRANVTASCRRDVPLPPIDERKILELEEKNHQNNLDVGAPPAKFRELYKKILYERSEKEAAEEERQLNPEMHWKRKMKLEIL